MFEHLDQMNDHLTGVEVVENDITTGSSHTHWLLIWQILYSHHKPTTILWEIVICRQWNLFINLWKHIIQED